MRKLVLILLFTQCLGRLVCQNNIIYVTSDQDLLQNVMSPPIGTLRWAVNQVNAYVGPGYSEIRFLIPLVPPINIALSTNLMPFQTPVYMDANTQPSNGYVGNDKKIVMTTNFAPGYGFVFGLFSAAGGSTIKNFKFLDVVVNEAIFSTGNSGNVFNDNIFYYTANIPSPPPNFIHWDIQICQASNHTLKGNIFGANANLQSFPFNIGTKIQILGGNGGNTIGGLNAGEPNFIYNSCRGIQQAGAGPSNRMSGNLFVNTSSVTPYILSDMPWNYQITSGCGPQTPYLCRVAPLLILNQNQNNQVLNISGSSFSPYDFIELYLSAPNGIDAVQLIATATTDALGQFNFPLNGYGPGSSFVATATDQNNNTSEFSSPVGVPPLCCTTNGFITNTGLQNIVNVSPGVYSASACNNISFNAGACAPTAPVYTWDFGDGPGAVNGANVSHQYAAAGSYVITALVTGSGCLPVTQTYNVNVSCCNPAITGAGSGGCVNSPVTFGLGCMNALASYNWNFGDGNTATGMPVSHAYSAAGNYNVSVTIINPPSAPVTVNTSISITQCPTINNCKDCIGSFSPEAGQYLLSLWVREENHPTTVKTYPNTGARISFIGSSNIYGPFFPNLAKNKIIDGWQRIEEKFTVPPGATSVKIELINNNTALSNIDSYYDDIRIFPLNGNMRSYVYDPLSLRLSAELDENNYATFFEYDEEGKLIRVKKETERGIMTVKESRTSMKKQ